MTTLVRINEKHNINHKNQGEPFRTLGLGIVCELGACGESCLPTSPRLRESLDCCGTFSQIDQTQFQFESFEIAYKEYLRGSL